MKLESLKRILNNKAKGFFPCNIVRMFLRCLSDPSYLILSILNMISALHPRGSPLCRRLRWLPGPGCCLARDSSSSRFWYGTGRCPCSHSRSRTRGITGMRRGRVCSLFHAGGRGIAGCQLLCHPGSSWLRKSNYYAGRERTRVIRPRKCNALNNFVHPRTLNGRRIA